MQVIPGAAARTNPFRSERIESLRFRFPTGDWDDALRSLAGLGWRGAIVGPEGSGKTTLLIELAARLRNGGQAAELLLADGPGRPRGRSWRELCGRVGEARGVVLLDGADRLDALQWWRVRRRARAAAGLVVTLHRPGRWPTWVQTATSPGLLAELVSELLDQSEAGPGGLPVDAEQLHRECGGNVRAALRLLYDRWASGHTAGAS